MKNIISITATIATDRKNGSNNTDKNVKIAIIIIDNNCNIGLTKYKNSLCLMLS